MDPDGLRQRLGDPAIGLHEAEAAAEAFHRAHGANAVLPLLRSLGEELPEELNFTIIHLVEQADVTDLVAGLIALTAESDPSGSEWLDLLHFRVLNSPDALRAYADGLRQAPRPVQRAVVGQLDRIAADERNLRFADRLARLRQVVPPGA